MEEPKVITIDDVIDSTAMHINKGNPLFARESKGNPHGTQGEPSDEVKFQHYILLSENRLDKSRVYSCFLSERDRLRHLYPS